MMLLIELLLIIMFPYEFVIIEETEYGIHTQYKARKQYISIFISYSFKIL